MAGPPSADRSTLDALGVGRRAVVAAVGGPAALKVRLWEMGLTPGTEVEVIKRAPLGDPLELAVRGYHLSIRRRDAAEVFVEPAGPGQPGDRTA